MCEDLLLRWLGIFQKKLIALEQHSRRAEAALNSTVLNKCPLQGMQFSITRKPFYRNYLFAGHVLYGEMTGANGRFSDDNRAGATLTQSASIFGAGQAKIGAKHPEERPVTISLDRDRTTVERETDGLFHYLPLSAIANRLIAQHKIALVWPNDPVRPRGSAGDSFLEVRLGATTLGAPPSFYDGKGSNAVEIPENNRMVNLQSACGVEGFPRLPASLRKT